MFSRQLSDAILERRGNEIDAAWIAGIRKSWKNVSKPVQNLAARADKNETRIDIDKIYKTADESVAALKKVLDYLAVLRQDLLFNKGLWTIRRVEKGKGGGARRDPAAKAVHELDVAEKAIRDNIDRVNHWRDTMTPGEYRFEMDGGRMYQDALTDLKSFNRMMSSVLPTGSDTNYEGIWAADPAISKRLLGVLSSRVKSMGGVIALNPVEPEVVHLGKMTVVFQDTPQKSPTRLDPAGHEQGKWRGPGERKRYIVYLKQAMQLLRRHNLGYLWYGKIFVLPKASAGKNPHGEHFGVGGEYQRSGDLIRVFENPSSFISELVIHELGHRYWFKFMSGQDRQNFGKWFNAVPATTSYGAVNTVEDFAEVFADYVIGVKKLNRDQVGRLKAFFGRKKRLEHMEPTAFSEKLSFFIN